MMFKIKRVNQSLLAAAISLAGASNALDAAIPSNLIEKDSIPIYELFQHVAAFKCAPLTLLKLKEVLEKKGFKILSSPSEIERLPIERAESMLKNMPFDQKLIVENISKSHQISPSQLFIYKMINSLIIQKL